MRLWIPLLVLAVIGVGGFTVSRLHGVFGSENRPSYADTNVSDAKSFDPKKMSYEVFGSPGNVADISYFDVNGDPLYIQKIPLPWSVKFEIGKTTAVGSIMAQGDGRSIGCRIIVDDEVKSEKVSTQTNAFTSCLLKAA
ncbi:putative membrane protein mmpS4 [Mycobacteroides salmoniphilum]|uniref:Membrane protein mmpS4 n=1 Tax=Mycobacteroides salmoniphilum TaxID=404941 RepID=A0A4R8SGR9_9MYCO|nr:MmpS family transport accessory protein [Mycobacteroides salmoniphilum]QCH25672.1 Putative membrane protein mmpS4 [Mycobacteroides salmoniphilum]TDZ76054.1 putative membrane protein mmpS4 [Mycobacteroides salmoniphilum]TDZ83638.1 putative membrane protein mmpS4 [Mycobacteroides salmoniphilum]TDZ84572.1 putative membrane protein mmpS4 [Mycobacteroides salmoniphilum]TDZ92835.1 putative membrane protein mmpS4 [Mycobacteroides salmoniphilum]